MKSRLKKIKNAPVEVKASIAYTVCSIIQKSLSFITLPLFTRLLTTAQYGQYTIYASWMSIFAIFITLELPYGSFNTAMTNFKQDRNGYISSVQTICTLLMLVALVIYLPFHEFLNKFLELPTLLVVIMFIEILFQSSFSFWCGKKRFEYKYISIIIITLLITILSPILATVFIVNSEEKGYARILGYSFVTILFGFVLYCLNFIRGRKPFAKEYWKYALTFNLPLLIYYISQMIFSQSDRLMISHLCGVEKVGIYGVAFNLSIMLTFVINSINNAYTPWVYKKIDDKRPSDNKKVSIYIAILMAVSLTMLIWVAPEIIYIMAGNAYMEAIWIVPPVAGSVFLLLYAGYFTNIEFLYKKKMSLIIASVIPALVNIVLNYVFIRKFGYIAAGYTTFISYVLFAFMNYLFIYRYVKKGADLYGLFSLKYLLLILTGFIAVNLIGMALYNFMIIRFVVMAIVGLILIIFRKKIFALLKLLKNKEECINDTEAETISQEA